MRAFFGLLAATTLAAGAVPAQTLKPENENFFNEALRPSAEISGAVVAGVQMHRKPGDAVGFFALLPEHLAGQGSDEDQKTDGQTIFCVRVVSANGLYDAENDYEVEAGETDAPMFSVVYPTGHAQFLEELENREVAAAISLGRCETRSREHIVASWQATPEESVTLLVNSFRADTVLVRFGDGPTVRCAPVAIEVRSAYDTECTLPLEGRAGRVGLEIFRFVNRQPAPETKIDLLLPGG